MSQITENVKQHILNIPTNVLLVAATKKRTVDDIKEAVSAGVKACGENYVQEAEPKVKVLGPAVQWHCIGHLQKNKVKKAVELFDMIQTVDSLRLVKEIEKRCMNAGRDMEILIEINIAGEKQKAGVMPDDIPALVKSIREAAFSRVRLAGLMTMGPWMDDPEELRPYFAKARALFEDYRDDTFRYLSMGMSDSWRVAIQEGANIVRIGTALFGQRT